MSKRIGLIGLILVFLWPLLVITNTSIREERISGNVERSDQEFEKLQEQYGALKLGDARLNEFINTQEIQKIRPRILETILVYLIYYILPVTALTFGLVGLFKDKGWSKILSVLSILGVLVIIYNILLERAFLRMV